MSNPYQSLIDRLRDLGVRSGEEAADVIELLTKQLAAGPVCYAAPMVGTMGGFTMAAFRASDVPVGAPLYYIPLPEVKE